MLEVGLVGAMEEVVVVVQEAQLLRRVRRLHLVKRTQLVLCPNRKGCLCT